MQAKGLSLLSVTQALAAHRSPHVPLTQGPTAGTLVAGSPRL